MFSNIVKVLSYVGVAFYFTACGLSVNESIYVNPSFKVKDDKYNCLSDIDVIVGSYFSGEIKNNEIDSFVSCNIYAFEAFEQYVQGANTSKYKPSEIRAFLETYFLKDLKISDSFLDQIMVFKTLLVGGDKQWVTHKELLDATEAFSLMGRLATKMNPHINILNHQYYRRTRFTNEDVPVLESAIEALEEVGIELSAFVQKQNVSYKFSDLEKFIFEVRSFISWTSILSDGNELAHWMRYLRIFKEISSGGDRELIEPDRWGKYFQNWTKWYGSLLRHQYYFKSQSDSLSPNNFNNVMVLTDHLIESIFEAIDNQENKVITYEQVEEMVFALDELDLAPFGLKPETITSFYKTSLLENAFLRHIDPDADVTSSTGLTKKLFIEMMREYYLWADIQCHINQMSPAQWKKMGVQSKYYNLDQAKDPIQQKVAQNNYEIKVCNNSELDHRTLLNIDNKKWKNEVRSEFFQLFNVRPFFKPGYDTAFIIPFSKVLTGEVKNSRENLKMLNLFRGVAHIGFRAFSEDRGEYSLGFTEKEFTNFYDQTKQVGTELNIMHPRNEDVGLRSYGESKFFTYSASGKGEKKSSYTEVLELIVFLYSSGSTSKQIYLKLIKVCGEDDRLGAFGLSMIERGCFEKHFWDILYENLYTLPGMQSFIQYIGIEQKIKMHNELYSAVHRDEDPADYVEYNEITAYLSMLHYIEGIFTRYNKDDKDTSLSPKELWKLYETLKVYVYEKVEHGLYSRELGKPESKSTIEEIKAAKIATNMEVESYKNKKGVSISYDSDTFVELQEESPTPIVKESLEENPEQVYYIDEHLFDRLAKNTFTFIANNKRKPKGSIEKVLSIRLNHNLYNFKNVLGSIDRLGLSQIFSVMIRMSDNKVDVSDQLDFVNFLKYEKAVNSTDLSSMQKSVQAEISTLKLAVNNIILSCPSSTDERIKYSCLKNSVYSYYVEKQSKYKITESLLRNKYIKKRDRLFRLLFPTGNLEKVEEHLFRMLLVFKFIEDHILPVSDVNYDGAINWGAAEEEHLELDYLVRYFKKNISDYEIKLASFERQSLGGAHPIAYFSEDSVEATTVTEELDYKNIVAQMLSLENYYDRSTSEEVFSALDRLVSPYGLNLVTDPSEVPGEAETIDIAYPLLFFAQKLTSLKYFNADL